jgi:autotransporter passenger strand-loop-strand repeat protein
MTTTSVTSGTTSTSVTVTTGNTLEILSGGTADATTILSGGTLLVDAGGSASGTIVSSGGFEDVSGRDTSATIDSGGQEVVSSGGTASAVVVNSGGLLTNSGGTVVGPTVNSGGTFVQTSAGSFSGAVNNGTILFQGNTQTDNTFFQATIDNPGSGAWVISAGTLAVHSGAGSAGEFVISSGGVLQLANGSGDVTKGAPIDFADFNTLLLINGPTMPTGVISGFVPGERWIDVTGLAFGAGGTVSVTGSNMLQVTEGGKTDSLQLDPSQTYAGLQFEQLSDDVGGTLVGVGQVATVSGGSSIFGKTVTSGVFENILGSASSSTVSAGGVQVVLSGGVASGTVLDGGQEILFRADANVTVNSGGVVWVDSGGSISGVSVNASGNIIISSGGVVSGMTLNALAGAEVFGGGTASGGTVESGGLLIVDPLSLGTTSGGTDIGTLVAGGGLLDVLGGKTISTTLIGSGTTDSAVEVLSGGTASATTISNTGKLVVRSGGVAFNTIVDSTGGFGSGNNGGLKVSAGGVASATTVNSGGTETVFNGGTDSGATVNSGGRLTVSSGGTAASVTLSGGEEDVFGTASNTIISSGGTEFVSSGGIAAGVAFGAVSATLDLARPTGLAGTLSDWLIGDVIDFVGTSVTSAAISGNTLTVVVSGGATFNYQLAGQEAGTSASLQSDAAGGTDVILVWTGPGAPPVENGETRIVSGGHMSNGLVVLSGGTEIVSAGGTDDGAQISGGQQEVYGIASGATVFSGSQVVESGGVAAGTVLSGGTEYVSSGGTAQSVTFGTTSATLKLESPSGLTGTISNWLIGDVIDFVGTSVTSASISGSTLTIGTSGGQSFSYQLLGQQTNDADLQSDGAGGTDVILAIETTPTLSVALSGNAIEGATLTATPTLGTDSDNTVADVTYQWQRNGVSINGATGSTYLVGEGDEGASLSVVASFTDDTGQSVQAASNATTAVTDVAPTLSVALSGNAAAGATLTATPTLGTDGDNTAADVTYQWQRNGAAISGATGSTYVVSQADEGASLSVVASFTDDTGQSVQASAQMTVTPPVVVGGLWARVDITTSTLAFDVTPGTFEIINDQANIVQTIDGQSYAIGFYTGPDSGFIKPVTASFDVSKLNDTLIVDVFSATINELFVTYTEPFENKGVFTLKVPEGVSETVFVPAGDNPKTYINDFQAPIISLPEGGGFYASYPQYIWAFVAPITSTLFTSGADVVDFNSLSATQQLTIASGGYIYNGLGGSDIVTLPDQASYNESVGNGQTLGWTNTAASTFHTESLPGDTYQVTGGDGSYFIVEGAGTEFITINGDGNSNITAGSGSDTITVDGNGNNTITAGSGTDTITINGNGNNAIYDGKQEDTINISGTGTNTIVDNGEPLDGTVTDSGTLVFDVTGTVALSDSLSGNGEFIVKGGGTLVVNGNDALTGDITIDDATLELTNANAAGTATITFGTSDPPVLKIDGFTMPTNVIKGFAPGDTIDLPSIPFNTQNIATILQTSNNSVQLNNVLYINDNGIPYKLQLDQNQDISGGVSLSADKSGGTQITRTATSAIGLPTVLPGVGGDYSVSVYPYSAVCDITSQEGVGGSGFIVGPHSILTAAHVVESLSGVPFHISIYPGSSPSAAPILVNPLDVHPNPLWAQAVLNAGPANQYDWAVINVSTNLSQYGMFQVTPDYSGGSVNITGYPRLNVQNNEIGNVQPSTTSNGTFLVENPVISVHGESGGPLWIYNGSVAEAVGVVAGASFSGAGDILLTADDKSAIQDFMNKPLAGKVAKGYVSGATVFADANGNGQLDPGEVSTTTDATGGFSLTGGSGPLVAFGGTDTSTGLPFKGQLSAPAGSTDITPLTTLLTDLASDPSAQQKVLSALGLSSTLNLTTFDPIAAAQGGSADGAATEVAGAKVYDTVEMIASTFAGAGGAFTSSLQAAFSALATALDGAGINLSDKTVLSGLITQVAQAEKISLGSGVADSVATVIAAGNAALDHVLQTDQPGTSLLNDTAAVELVMQGPASTAIQQAVSNTARLQSVVGAFTGTSLGTLISTALNQLGPDTDTGEQTALHLTVNPGAATSIGASGAGSVAFTTAGLDLEDSATVTFTDGNGKTIQVSVNGGQTSYTANLSTLRDGPITSSLTVTTDPAGNTFTAVAGNTVTLAQYDHWTTARSGDWSTAANWSRGVPTGTVIADVDASGPYAATISTADTAYGLVMNDSGASITDKQGGSLTLTGPGGTSAPNGALSVAAGNFTLASGALRAGSISIGSQGSFVVT